MFTGIVEGTGKLVNKLEKEGSVEFEITCDFTKELKIDQSVSHNGVCLTVTDISGENYFVTAIPETLKKTNLGLLKPGDALNLERSMPVSGRFDGHIVQGHVDQTAVCKSIKKEGESQVFTFEYDTSTGNFTVEKGSVCVNGVSLTVVNSNNGMFSVAIIPYTFEHTNLKSVQIHNVVNIEFDIIGKYLHNLFLKYRSI